MRKRCLTKFHRSPCLTWLWPSRRSVLQRWCRCMAVFLVVALLFAYYEWAPQWHQVAIPAKQCRFPALAVDNSEITSHLLKIAPLSCHDKDFGENWICVDRTQARLCNQSAGSTVVCQYTFLEGTTTEVHSGAVVESHGAESVDLQTDAFNVKCQDMTKPEVIWKSTMAGIAKRPVRDHGSRGAQEPEEPKQYPFEMLNVSVLLWDLGSLSRLTFQRKLPQTYKYLAEELRAFIFSGYTSIDYGDQDPLMTILTGVAAPQSTGHSVNWSTTTFIWDTFSRHGFVTALAEDGVISWARPPRSTIFDARPTDHHLGPYFLELVKQMGMHAPYCNGIVPRHKVTMDWTLDFFDTYRTVPKLAIVAHRELAEDGILQVADDDMVNFLKTLQDKKHLASTLLLLLSDSGPKPGTLGMTQQAKMEEQSPFLAIVAPLVLEFDFPDSVISLVGNAQNKLVTQLDIHATLTSVLNFVEGRHGRRSEPSISLLDEIPTYRNCRDAQIPDHHCTCLEHFWLSPKNWIVNKGSVMLIDYFNDLTKPHRSTCLETELESIEWAQIAIPKEKMVAVADTELYKVRICVQPGSRHYVADFTYDISKDKFNFDIHKIHRVANNYDELECTFMGFSDNPKLAEICYCPIKKK